MRHLLLSTLLLFPAAAIAQTDTEAGEATPGVATMQDTEGNEIGEVRLEPMESGHVNVVFDLTGIPAGPHGVHLHQVGDCSADDFSSAGGHIEGDGAHGFDNPDGPHAGDLPNAHVQEDGVLMLEHMSDLIMLDESMVFDEDGSAVVVHANADDYRTEPSGDSGDRIACGVIEPASAQ